jgi:lipoprotein-anchoring transpeptidase ErfK/SrfK
MRKITAIFLILTILFPVNFVFAAEKIDLDGDGLSDELEQQIGTDLGNKDTDGDGYIDGVEVESGYNPLIGNANRAVSREVVVDLTTQQSKYFFNGVEIGQIPVSTGILKYATPTGDFKILRKLPVHHYKGIGYDLPNTKWNLEFKRGFYLHGAYWHNQFGIKPMSHGCVNISYKDVEKLYKFLQIGDKVKIVGKTPPKGLVSKPK